MKTNDNDGKGQGPFLHPPKTLTGGKREKTTHLREDKEKTDELKTNTATEAANKANQTKLNNRAFFGSIPEDFGNRGESTITKLPTRNKQW